MPPNPSSPGGGSGRRRRRRSSTSTALAHAFNPITHPKPHRSHTTAPVTDVQSSGGNYGIPKANRYKRTRAYKRTSRSVYRAQSTGQRKRIVRASRGARHKSVEQRQALRAHRHWKREERGRQQGAEALGQVTPHQARVMGAMLSRTSNVFQPFTNPTYSAPHPHTPNSVKSITFGTGAGPSGIPKGLKSDVAAGLYPHVRVNPNKDGLAFQVRKSAFFGLHHDWVEGVPVLKRVGNGQVMVAGWQDWKQASGFQDASVAEPLKGVGAMVGQAAVLAGRATGSKIVKNAGQNLVDLPAETVPSLVKLAEDTIKNPGKGLHEFTDPYKKLIEDPKGSFEKNPIYSLLMAEGIRAPIARGAGFAMRRGAFGAAARKAAKTERAPLAVAGTSVRDVRRYSPDVMVKLGQVGKEALDKDRIRRLHKRADDLEAQGKPETAGAKRDRARALEIKPVNRMLKRRVNENRDMAEKRRRADISETGKALRDAADKKLGVGYNIVGEGITKASHEDLKAYRDELKAVYDHGDLTPSQKKFNKDLRNGITDLTNENLSPARMREAVANMRNLLGSLENEAIDAGFLKRGEVDRAKLISHATRNMGALVRGAGIDTKPLARVVAATRRAAKTADKRVEDLRRQGGIAQGRAEVLSRNVAGRQGETAAERAGNPRARLKSQYAGGGHGVRGAEAAFQDAVGRAERAHAEAEQAHVALKTAQFENKREVLRGRDGKMLTDEQIKQHIAKHGYEDPLFVTQRTDQSSEGANFRDSGRPPQMVKQRRTGKSTLRGTYEAGLDTVIDHGKRLTALVSQHRGFTSYINEFAYRDPKSGDVLQFHQRAGDNGADRAAADINALGGVPVRVVRMAPFMGTHDVMHSMLDNIEPDPEAIKEIPKAIETALDGSGQGPFTIVPEATALQMKAHTAALGTGVKLLQKYTQMFSRGVLATSPPWAVGNVTEAAFRSLLVHAGPVSYVRAHAALKWLEKNDPEAFKDLQARALAGGHFAFRENSRVRRMAEQFAGDHFEGVVKAFERLRNTPGPKQLADAWDLYSSFVFHSMGKTEKQFQKAMLGRYMSKYLMDSKGKANFRVGVKQAAEGLRGTNEQVAAARWVDRAYGQYSKFGPETRKTMALYTPFASWYLNSVRFFAQVLPADHPVLLSLMASSLVATQEWRKRLGLTVPLGGASDNQLPGFLQGSIPLSGGRHQRFPTRYTPFGAFTSPTETMAGLLLPQFAGTWKGLQGMDWKNEMLRNPDGSRYGEGQRIHYAVTQGLLSMFPVAEKLSAIYSSPMKALNPFYPVQPTAGSASSSGRKRKRRGGASSGIPSIPSIPSVPIPSIPSP